MTIIGCDIGQVSDPTAIVILQPKPGDRHRLDCRWAERVLLGTPYHEIIDRVDTHRQKVGKAIIAWDETGVGRPVVEQAKKRIRGARHIGITITGGANATFHKGWHIPKRHLITNLQMLLQSGTLRISDRIPKLDLDAMLDELKLYKVKIEANAHETYGPWREGLHDDLVLALAIGSYAAVKLGMVVPKKRIVLVGS